MRIIDVIKKFSEIGDFPKVVIKNKIKSHPNTEGQITKITKEGVSVNLGANWDKWFYEQEKQDKRSSYMKELKFKL